MNLPKYEIGQKYKPVRKNTYICEIIDILKTYNSKNELVKIRYVAVHEFLGQKIIDNDVVQTTIDRSELIL